MPIKSPWVRPPADTPSIKSLRNQIGPGRHHGFLRYVQNIQIFSQLHSLLRSDLLMDDVFDDGIVKVLGLDGSWKDLLEGILSIPSEFIIPSVFIWWRLEDAVV